MNVKKLVGKGRSFLAHSLYAQIITLALLAVLAILLMLLADRSLGKSLTANLPAEALGVAISALVTVFIVERALAAAEKRRWDPSVQAAFHRVLAQCSRAITHLAMYYQSRPGELRIETPRRWAELLSESMGSAEMPADLHSFAHDWVFSEVSIRNQQIQTMTSQWQVIVSRHPDLFPCIQAIDDAIADWSFTRHFFASGVPQTDRELELDVEAVRPVAETFLALRTQLLNALPDDFEGE